MTQAQEKLSETPEQTIARLRKELADEKAKRPRLGLVWEDRPESVQQELITKLPVFVRQPDLDITPPPR